MHNMFLLSHFLFLFFVILTYVFLCLPDCVDVFAGCVEAGVTCGGGTGGSGT